MTDFDKLFEEWQRTCLHERCRVFVRDGIIERHLWSHADLNVAFLLKESNESKSELYGTADLCEWVRTTMIDRARHKMWRTLSQWAYGIHGLSKGTILPFPSGPEMEKPLADALLASAVINVKKSDGGASSNYADLERYASEDARFLKRQLRIIGPDLLVCGSTWCLFRPFFTDVTQVAHRVFKVDDIYVVDFGHPANRYPNDLNYYALCAMISSAGILPTRDRTEPLPCGGATSS